MGMREFREKAMSLRRDDLIERLLRQNFSLPSKVYLKNHFPRKHPLQKSDFILIKPRTYHYK